MLKVHIPATMRIQLATVHGIAYKAMRFLLSCYSTPDFSLLVRLPQDSRLFSWLKCLPLGSFFCRFVVASLFKRSVDILSFLLAKIGRRISFKTFE